MAFQINPNIPLQAMDNPINIGDAFTKAQSYQAKRLELDRLREQFNEEKEARLRQKQMQQGIASELQKMQQGTPAQYNTTFPQTMPTGQMPQTMTGVLARPQGMTGVLASERGQNIPSPDLFGENILKGNFDVRREMIAPEVKGVTPDYMDILNVSAKNALQVGDIDSFIRFSNAIQQAKTANDIEWGTNPTKGINPQTGLPDAYITNRKGDVKWLGSGVYEAPKDPKAPITWTVPNGRKETVYGYDANGKPIVLGVKSLDAPPKTEKPITGYQKIKLEGELRDDYRKDSANFVEISRQAKIIESSLNDDSAAATLASATAFMKMLDPGSVVRESELAMAMKTNGALDRMGNYINVIQSGQVLTKQQKADFAKLIKAYSNASNEAQRNLNKKYSQISIEYGLDPKRVAVYDVEKEAKPEKVEADRPTTINHGDTLSQLPATAPKGAVAKNAQTGKPEFIFNGSKWIPVGGSK